VRMLKVVEGIQEVALITNGSLLQGLVLPLRSAGLDRLTVSLDSLEPATFEAMSGHRMRLPPVLGGLASAREAGFSPIKLNVVVMRGVNDHGVVDMARHFRGNHFIPRFIEFMDVGNRNGWSADRVVPSREILARIHAAFPLLPVAPAYRGEVASRYRYADGEGEIGFISSVSQPFCHDCSRICLFARDGFDLRGPLRAGASDQEMGEMLSGLWRRRADRYSEERATERQPAGGKVEMYHIGG